ncbi:MAG: iron-siderophore ABC transporter substrate-binding protein [Acidobacteria bacterium]|nr:iron-siderophore ABC transporter substrate-binding protein [Acidobacteriota bacterium]
MKLRYTRTLLLLMITALALAACGGESGDASGDGGSSGETRTVEHAAGESEVAEDPERVVVLDTGELDSAMTLGVTPVGAVEAVEGEGYPSYLEDTEEIEDVGTIEQPNLERIASLEPDLILSSQLRHEDIYDQLSEIAPTVFTETTGVTWRENFMKHAEALNTTEEAESIAEDYEARMEEFRSAMGEDRPEVSVVRFLPGETRIYQKESFVGTVLEDAGLPRPESQDVDDFAILEASQEFIPEMGGDVIFTTVYGPEEDSTVEEITTDPLWQELEAVQEDRVYEVPDDTWMLGIGYTSADRVTGDLFQYLAEGEETTRE